MNHIVVLLGIDARRNFEHTEQVSHADYLTIANFTHSALGTVDWRRQGQKTHERT